MKKIKSISFLIVIIILVSFGSAAASNFDVDVDAAILIDAETAQVLFEKNPDQRRPPASITKVMLMLIAMEEIEKGNISLDDEVTISQYAESMGGSQIFLDAGTRITVQELLKAVTIASANDASVALAENIAGTYGNFINWMNERAEELGMENTHFVNSTGLPPEYGEHYSTPRDITIMSRELVQYPIILEWASIWHDTLELPGRNASLTNTNKLINRYPGMDGLKTGHTSEAGFCLSATAKRHNMRLISVVMNASTEKEREEVTTRLLDYGFNAFSKEKMVSKGEEVQNIEIPEGKNVTTTVEAAEDLNVVVRRGARGDLDKEININKDVNAPVKKGDVLGNIAILEGETILNTVELIATEDIERAGFLMRFWRNIVSWFRSLIGSQ